MHYLFVLKVCFSFLKLLFDFFKNFWVINHLCAGCRKYFSCGRNCYACWFTLTSIQEFF